MLKQTLFEIQSVEMLVTNDIRSGTEPIHYFYFLNMFLLFIQMFGLYDPLTPNECLEGKWLIFLNVLSSSSVYDTYITSENYYY